jgi:hypothetical protein
MVDWPGSIGVASAALAAVASGSGTPGPPPSTIERTGPSETPALAARRFAFATARS